MAFTIAQQFHETLGRAGRVLLVMRPHSSTDDQMATRALQEILLARGAEVTIADKNIGSLHELEVRIEVESDAERARTNLSFDGAAIVLRVTPATGVLTPSAVISRAGSFRFDLIVTIGAPDLASLGELYSKNAALFSALPIINVDHSPTNEFFAHVNCVDITQSSNCELLFTLFETHGDAISPQVAHLFLTGMISATQSFKTHLVQARTLQTASQLMALGADREQIMHQLYRQRSVATLRLWGAALSHTESDTQQQLVWSTLTRDDFARSGASETDLQDLCDELVYTCPHARVFVLAYEHPTTGLVYALVDTQHPHTAAQLMSGFIATELTPHAHRVTTALETPTLADGLQKVLNVVRTRMKR